MTSLFDPEVAGRSNSPEDSLSIASTKTAFGDPPAAFGVIRAKKLMAANTRAAVQAEGRTSGHVPRRQAREPLEELDDGEVDDTRRPGSVHQPRRRWRVRRQVAEEDAVVGTEIGRQRWRTARRGFADAPDELGEPRRVSRFRRRPRPPPRTSPTSSANGFRYPEWDANRKSYRPDWCTVREVEPQIKPSAPQAIDAAIGVRRPLARLGMGLHRRHRQPQGDDIDIDAAVEARVEVLAGSVPDEAVYLDSLRRRRDLSVLLLLDVSGFDGRAGHRRTHRASATTRGGRRPDRRAARSGRPRGAVRLLLAGAVRR